MKPEDRNNWRGEDFEFQQEFQDVSDIFQKNDIDTSPVPGYLDRQIKELAYHQVAEELDGHWLVGGIPQLSMAVSLLFAVGILFVVSVDKDEVGSALTEKQLTTDFVPSVSEEKRAMQMRTKVPTRESRQVPAELVQTFSVDRAQRLSAESFTEDEAVVMSAAPAEPPRPTLAENNYFLVEKADPIYPKQAIQQKIAGWVRMEFTISRTGEVQDPIIIDHCADPAGQPCTDHTNSIFDDAAKQAVRQFKYKPRNAGGEVVAVEGVQYSISFQLPALKEPLDQKED